MCNGHANVCTWRSLSSCSVLSPTLHLIFTTSTITVVAISILLTVYKLRDTRTASDDSLVLVSNGEEDAAQVLTYDAAKSTSLFLHNWVRGKHSKDSCG